LASLRVVVSPRESRCIVCGETIPPNVPKLAWSSWKEYKTAEIGCVLELIEEKVNVNRRCLTCTHFNEEDSTCLEGGYSEIGDPSRWLSEVDCNAWDCVHRRLVIKYDGSFVMCDDCGKVFVNE